MTTPALPSNHVDRASRIALVLEQVVRRRIAGDDVPDDRIVSDHSDLMPELADELAELLQVDRARRLAASSHIVLDTWPAQRGIARPPARLSGYEFTGEMHRGGQGVVYRAVQSATRRAVAVKLLRDGALATPQERVRFERELQILARLRHPNIVAVHDGGIAEGQVYLVMDYIAGVPLDQHWRLAGDLADRASLQRQLALFAKICDAVQAAHMNGITHRDIKPANIRVDESGEPHVLDFGLAKNLAIAEDASAVTETGQFIGSLPWASPEQAAGDQAAIDIRTDVYSLGVVLYQMLTGAFPYPVQGQLRHVLDHIARTEPCTPSRLKRTLDAELDAITLKCLQKSADRRYQSAGELARDVRRYLAHEAIEARRDSTWYVVRKGLYKHRVAAAVTGVFALTLIGATISLTWLYQQSEARREEAERQSAKAREIQAFLSTVLSSGQPESALGRALTVADVLHTAAERADRELTDQTVAAAVQHTIGAAYASLGDYPRAKTHLARALDIRRLTLSEPHPDLSAVEVDLGTALKDAGELSEAEPHLRHAIATFRMLPNDGGAAMADALGNLGHLMVLKNDYAAAEALVREALRVQQQRLGTEHAATAKSLTNLAFLLVERGEFDEAESLYQQALAARHKLFGNDHPDVTGTLLGLAKLHYRRGNYPRAEEEYRKILAADRKIFGKEHPNVATTLTDLGAVLQARGKLELAKKRLQEALRIQRDKLDARHPNVSVTLLRLASCLRDLGDLPGAEALAREALEARRAALGESHMDTIDAADDLAAILRGAGKLEDAEPLLQMVMEGRRAALGVDHAATLIAQNNLARIWQGLGRIDDAEALFRATLAAQQRTQGNQHNDTLTSLNNLGLLLMNTGRPSEAEPYSRQAAETRRRVLGDDHLDTLVSMNNLGLVLSRLGRVAEAEPLFRHVLSVRESRLGELNNATLTSVGNLAECLLSLDKSEEALALARRAYEGRRESQGETHAATLLALHQLANTEFEARRLEVAESLARQAWEGRRNELGPNHAETLLTMNLLANIRSAQNQDDEAALLFQQVIAEADAALPTGHPYRAIFQCSVGQHLEKTRRYSEAAPMLAAGIADLTSAWGGEHRLVRRAIASLARVRDATGEHIPTSAASRETATAPARATAPAIGEP